MGEAWPEGTWELSLGQEGGPVSLRKILQLWLLTRSRHRCGKCPGEVGEPWRQCSNTESRGGTRVPELFHAQWDDGIAPRFFFFFSCGRHTKWNSYNHSWKARKLLSHVFSLEAVFSSVSCNPWCLQDVSWSLCALCLIWRARTDDSNSAHLTGTPWGGWINEYLETTLKSTGTQQELIRQDLLFLLFYFYDNPSDRDQHTFSAEGWMASDGGSSKASSCLLSTWTSE